MPTSYCNATPALPTSFAYFAISVRKNAAAAGEAVRRGFDQRRCAPILPAPGWLSITTGRLAGSRTTAPTARPAIPSNALRREQCVLRRLPRPFAVGQGDVSQHHAAGGAQWYAEPMVKLSNTSTAAASDKPGTHSVRSWLAIAGLLAAATAFGALLDPYVSLTSQAMLYVLVVVLAAYRLDWVQSAVCAVGAVTALNFFFVPPRWTFEVENREHLIALAVMLVVALVISQLAVGLRRETRHAALSEQRARQLQALASSLANATTSDEVAALGQQALDAAFGGPNALALASGDGAGHDAGTGTDIVALDADQPDAVRDGLRCCMKESAVLGPGTGRWPGLDAWYVPLALGEPAQSTRTTQALGAVCIRPAPASDADGCEHAQALCGLLAQALWRVHLAATVRATQLEVQRQQLQSTFLAAVSHDLRTPLAAIVGAASSLQTQAEKLSPAEQHRLLGSIASEAIYLSTVTENTLQLVRLASTQQALGRGWREGRDWESLEEIVGTVLARVRQRDPTRRIKSAIPADLPLIKADPVLLAQLIGNLLDNALAYSDGDVDLAATLFTSADTPAMEQSIVVSVKDRGPGIAPADQHLIFEPYRRGDQSGSREARGAGLGLALCRAIAVTHGGSLTVRRRSGGGSSFNLTLPLDGPPPSLEKPS